jgi:hypothetical protein
MNDLIVYKLDVGGRVVWQYPARVLERGPKSIRLEAFFNRADLDLGYTTFKRGDRFIEHFYSDRWFNIFAVYDRDSSIFKGWYCNVCKPAAIEEVAVSCVDLALDVWVTPDGQTAVLDEDEFVALSLTDAELENGRSALQELLSMARLGDLPQ